MFHRSSLPCLILSALLISSPQTFGHDFVKSSGPQSRIDSMLPEDLPELNYPAYYSELDKARMQAFRGRYRLALQTLHILKQGDPAETALIRATALAAIGQTPDAIRTLSQPALADDPRMQLLRARILSDAGRLQDSRRLLSEHLQAHPDSLEGHYYMGEVCEKLGDLESAKSAYQWFNAPPRRLLDKWQGLKEKAFDNAEQVVLLGRATDRLATLTGAYQNNRPLHDLILGLFVRAYDVIDRSYWPAHMAAAEYFLSHDQEKQALAELQAALSANPNDARSLQLLASIAIGNFDFDKADSAIASLRKTNPLSPIADLLECRNLMQQRKAQEAAAPVQRVLASQPNNIEALGLLAAVYALQLKDDQAEQILKQIDQLDPNNATAFLDVAEQLAALRQYPRSAALYQRAIQRAPWWTAPRNGLGLLYTQSGDEDQARVVLDAAHALDPFNLRTTNYLRLLDELASFARKETAHFVIFYDAKIDPVIPEYFGDYLETVFTEVCRDFDHQPAVKTFIEVFPTHDAFSVRTTGSPWIGTVGASTGRVIALVSPRKGADTLGAFNWAEVLRHEFTHTVTLSATDNRITHWMTEGLAVEEEGVPLRWEWVPMLYDAVKKNELFTLDSLTWGFVRPRRPIDRQLAYAQSYWICRYIRQKYGNPAILNMMAEFKRGVRQEDVFPKVLHRSQSQFTEDFFAWAKEQVSTWGYDEATSKKYDALRQQGESLIQSHQYAQAIPIWEQIARLRPVDALPHQRLAGLYLTSQLDQKDKAIAHLIVLSRMELKNNRYAKKIARLYRDAGQAQSACQYALQAVYIDPYDSDAHELLAQLYETAHNAPGLAQERRVITILSTYRDQNP